MSNVYVCSNGQDRKSTWLYFKEMRAGALQFDLALLQKGIPLKTTRSNLFNICPDLQCMLNLILGDQ